MIELARPGFLVAGALLALIPLALHFITRRPPERAPLPTARFLRPDARMTVRVRRRPADLLLLALRMLLLVLVGAAFAGPTWAARRVGTETVVLLDAGDDMAPVWEAALDSARARLVNGGTLIVFDSAARVHRDPAEAIDALAGRSPTAPGGGYAIALGALLSLDRTLPAADSANVALITLARWSAWRAGVPALRAAWPGGIELVVPRATATATATATTAARPTATATATSTATATATATATRSTETDPGSPSVPDSVAGSRTGGALVVGGREGGTYLRAAASALGYTVDETAVDDPFAVAIVDAGAADAETIARLGSAARAGASVLVHGGGAAAWGGMLPWTAGADARPAVPIAFADGLLLEGAAVRLGGRPSSDADVVAHWLDGRPAAAARTIAAGCIAYVATDLEGGTLPLSATFPDALRALLHGCERGTGGAMAGTEPVPLDSGALVVLRGEGGAVPLESLAAGDPTGRPLVRMLLALALLIALVETWLAYRRRNERT